MKDADVLPRTAPAPLSTERETTLLLRGQERSAPTDRQQLPFLRKGLGRGWLIAVPVMLCILFLVGLAAFKSTRPPAPEGEPPKSMHPHESKPLVFFVVGDWGRHNNTNQLAVAEKMGNLTETYKPAFVASVGDNFYEHGLSGVDDPMFNECFIQAYSHPGLKVLPFYAVLGNHDYGDGLNSTALAEGASHSPLWQISSGVQGQEKTLADRDPRWNLYQGAWRRSYGNGLLDVIYIDTTPLLEKYQEQEYSDVPGGITNQNSTEQLQAMQRLLQSSRAKWKLVVGHHPVHSFGSHCFYNQTGDCLQISHIEPILQRHEVDAYFTGHEHNLQLIKQKQDGVLHVISGAGSNTRVGALDQIPPGMTEDLEGWFLSENPGFVAVTVDNNALTVDYWDVENDGQLYRVQKNAT